VASAVPSRNFYISNLQRQISSKKGVRTTYRPPQIADASTNQMLRNEFANLPQQVQFRPGCQAFAYAFRPCPVAGLRPTFQLFF
jgi:hypothetical protein